MPTVYSTWEIRRTFLGLLLTHRYVNN